MEKQITREKIDHIHVLMDSIKEASELASELLRTAQDRGNDIKHKMNREGQEIEITEKVMWEEVFYHPNGPSCQSGKILSKKYPELFKAYADQEKLADELNKYCITEIGIDYRKMSLSDYMKITDGIFDLKMKEMTKITGGGSSSCVAGPPARKEKRKGFMEKIMESLGR
ncbi:hypothetical protein DRQ25_00940 [Candidatus Fermentibacteria bacterium]|nr:MAG: hypothetical protein DRQ25_00940 [Candidatus Fermentibacteria bacterium]